MDDFLNLCEEYLEEFCVWKIIAAFFPSISVFFHSIHAFCFWSTMFNEYSYACGQPFELFSIFWMMLSGISDRYSSWCDQTPLWKIILTQQAWVVCTSVCIIPVENGNTSTDLFFCLYVTSFLLDHASQFCEWYCLPCFPYINLSHCVSFESCHSIFRVLSKSNTEDFFLWLYSLLC